MSADKWIWGAVEGNGDIHSGSGFSVEKVQGQGDGRYIITYSNPFTFPPAVVVNQIWPGWGDFSSGGGDPRDNSTLIASDRTHFKVKTALQSGHGVDRRFMFIAIGPA